MARKKFDVNEWTIGRYINDIPDEQYTEEERERLFEQMLINAVHSIGLVFEDELREINNANNPAY